MQNKGSEMGYILLPVNRSSTGSTVADLHAALQLGLENKVISLDLRSGKQLSSAFKRERETQIYGEATAKLVSLFQAVVKLPQTGEVDEATAEAGNEMLKRFGLLDPSRKPSSEGYRVTGQVVSTVSAGAGGLDVVILDKGLGDDAVLARAVTDADGFYEAGFAEAAVADRGKTEPDLQARVLAGKTVLGASDVRYNASRDEELDVLLDADATASLPSEYDGLTKALSARFAGRLGDLKETDERSDITYLANKTGWDARAVALAALSDQFSARTAGAGAASEIPQPLFYALFRAGLPANEETLYRIDAGTLREIWKDAAEQGVIAKTAAKDIATYAARFQEIGARRLLDAPASVGVSPMRSLLAVSGLDEAQQESFTQLCAAHGDDMPALWKAVGSRFGADLGKRLQLDGRLGLLTVNNADLMRKVHGKAGRAGLADPAQLAQMGLAEPQAWRSLLGTDVPIPAEIPGEGIEEKRVNYGEYLAAQVRLAYPTAAVAHLIRSGAMPVEGRSAGLSDKVASFLGEQQGKFEIGVDPVQRYVRKNGLEVADETMQALQRVQRVYQITPGDKAMTVLMKRGVGAALDVVRYDKRAFVEEFAADLGGEDQAALVHDRSSQVHGAVLNIAMSYVTARNAPVLGRREAGGAKSLSRFLDPAPAPANADDIVAYATLERLFGALDYGACDDCRSILSPAAYLVDLLLFLDHPEADGNPQEVLLRRRPDIAHLPLTCENTETPLPYIDIVNETLEYYVANGVRALSLDGYAGHDTGDDVSADLLASPHHVLDAAYAVLAQESFPPPLPFHRPLEALRRYFGKFDVPLAVAMERLRQSDDLERGANAYGWRDILMEEVGLSRQEHAILTESGTVPLWRMSGFAAGTTNANVVASLSNARVFARRAQLGYDDLFALLGTRFVNPDSDLIPAIRRLGVDFATIAALKTGAMPDGEFDARLAALAVPPDPARYRGDIKAWLRDDDRYARIMALILLTDVSGNPDPGSFETVEFRHAQPMASPADISTRLSDVDFLRMQRFVRLWKKLGWSVEQTDAAICALMREDMTPPERADLDNVEALDAGFLTLLPRLGVVLKVMKALNLTVKRDLDALLACWADIGTHGGGSLYRRLFLDPAILDRDPVFADDGYGQFLSGTALLAQHAEALRSAFSLTGDEYAGIVADLGFDAETPLTVANASAIFRRGWLARALKLSVRELLALIRQTGLDPFAKPDPANPAILRLIELVGAMKERGLKPASALYLIWNEDLSGAATEMAEIAEFARSLRADFADIDSQFAVIDASAADVARARIALIYGQETSDAFFAFLDDTVAVEAAYTHAAPVLDEAILDAVPTLSYDHFAHVLTHRGVLTAEMAEAARAAAGADDAFGEAVDALALRARDLKGSFFGRNPELKDIYETTLAEGGALVSTVDYASTTPQLDPAIAQADGGLSYDHAAGRLSCDGLLTPARRDRLKNLPGVSPAFLQAIDDLFEASETGKGRLVQSALQPRLLHDRKRLHVLQRLAGAAGVDQPFAQAMLDAAGAPHPLHAAGKPDRPGIDDAMALESPGLSARFHFRNTATGDGDLEISNDTEIDYGPGAKPLPGDGGALSAVWAGKLEAAEAGFVNLVVEAGGDAAVTLVLDGAELALLNDGRLWRNAEPLELEAGAIYDLVLTVEKISGVVRLNWETPKRPRGTVPGRYLHSPAVLAPFAALYTRFLKAAALKSALGLTAGEMAHLAASPAYAEDGEGWLGSLPVGTQSPGPGAFLRPLRAMLELARIKTRTAAAEGAVLSLLQGALPALPGWDRAALDGLLARFGATAEDLGRVEFLARIVDALDVVAKLGAPVAVLSAATTNDPAPADAAALQAALRARYDTASWRDVIQPVNDEMRTLQRDALVAFILHRMRSDPASAHIDTPDKLFEYFLMDVQMQPGMQTSRVRHALSTVQLFVERCLMDLERDVSPKTFGAQQRKQWEWMKRYRVWEANRKVFLYPENWLEPELRDDKSPFFKDLESELLQSDITEDSARSAMLAYLAKLESVARLEPCGIHHSAADARSRRPAVSHVVARTTGASRKYYYRRCEAGSWSPWEDIKADIKDGPVMPAVWRDRVLLFWLMITKTPKTSATTPAFGGDTLAGVNPNNLKVPQPLGSVHAALCWSEYYDGKWQPTKTSDVAKPFTLLDNVDISAFDPSRLRLSIKSAGEGGLVIAILRRRLVPGRSGRHRDEELTSLTLYDTNGLPVRTADASPSGFVINLISSSRKVGEYTRKLTASYDRGNIYFVGSTAEEERSFSRTLLQNGLVGAAVQPNHPGTDPWTAPFFYSDNRNTFYVTTSHRTRSIFQIPFPAVVGTWGKSTCEGPEIAASFSVTAQKAGLLKRKLLADQPFDDSGPDVIEPGSALVDIASGLRQVIHQDEPVRFGDRQIGPKGAVIRKG